MGKGSRKYTTRTITLRIELFEKVQQMAREQNRNFSNMVETLLIQVLDKGEK